MALKIHPAGRAALPLVRRAQELKTEAETEAKKLADPTRAYDQVWCVFDVDNHVQVPESIVLASEESIRVAISNPCFELWLLLHFEAHTAERNGHFVTQRLQHFLPDYDKHVRFEKLRDSLTTAIARAEKLDKDDACSNGPGPNPSTCVYRIARIILGKSE